VQDHPLRAKALRLQSKAETLLNAITDKRERTDPFIPHSLAGAVASASGAGPAALTAPVPKAPGLSRRPTTTSVARPAKPSAPAELAFPDTPALTRTPAGMAAFLALDAELAAEPGPGPSSAAHLAERLRAHLPPVASDEDGDDLSAGEDATPPGGKRKLYVYACNRMS
jgi:transcriptional activator SPT7